MIIGVISDTHGNISNQALNALKGAAAIIHAGDVGDPGVIETLQRIAPVTAVRGNTDGRSWAARLPLTDMVLLAEHCFYVLHDLAALDIDPLSAGINVVIHGHTHQAQIHKHNEIMYFNPGSASVQRHGGPLTVGRISVLDSKLQPQIIQLGL